METFADFYAKGDYPNALAELEKNRDSISPGLWHFNVGTVKAKLVQPAEARFHFLKARFEGYHHEHLSRNLSLVEKELEISTLEKPLEISDYAMKFGLWASQGFFTTLALLILVGGLVLMKRQRNASVLVFTVVLMLFPVGVSFWVKSLDKAVSIKELEVLEGPSVIFSSKGELPPGVLLITKSAGEWLEIKYPSRFQGWVRSSGIKELE